MNSQTCHNPDGVEHHFVLKSENLREILDWVYRHDNAREYTSYVYGHFCDENPAVKEGFRGFRLYISDVELALLFKITFSDKIHLNHFRNNDINHHYGTRF